MFHPDDPLRGKYLTTYHRQMQDEVEAARARQSRRKADRSQRSEVSPDEVPITGDQRQVSLAARLAPER